MGVGSWQAHDGRPERAHSTHVGKAQPAQRCPKRRCKAGAAAKRTRSVVQSHHGNDTRRRYSQLPC